MEVEAEMELAQLELPEPPRTERGSLGWIRYNDQTEKIGQTKIGLTSMVYDDDVSVSLEKELNELIQNGSYNK